ncbi:phosphoenolpyruvate carboxylase [Marivirga sp. S37H4]|uniref:Phosphoenolpyruvate carboxylase n=1 Tax=Marivirga aurantiaca TaxID=2802615 RepID=A0A935CA69_9BACT|nr:phosphoenolpyruvate carboxylase [Marivirga aurantiaca]MBK6266591.1 phosphoenolpyruvate carboxylase [Marivirga aurantiaca]
MKNLNYQEEVTTRFTVYNSLFLDLPYGHIYRTGTVLPMLQQLSQSGYEEGKDPVEIIEKFQRKILGTQDDKELHNLLFQLIQYIERQVLLFDSIEDAAFGKIYNLEGKGSVKELIGRVRHTSKMEELKEKLKNFSVRIVLTAHPTQFYPGNVLAINNDLEAAIRTGDLNTINSLLKQLGKTPFIKRDKPSPYDEAVSLCWYLENVFYKSIPAILYDLAEDMDESFEEWINPNLLTVGFWPGGDRDGNPFVTHDITLKVADRLRETILKCYYRDIRAIRRRLTFKGVEEKIQEAENKVYHALFGDKSKGFINPDELLQVLHEALENLKADHMGLFSDLLEKFILKVRIFGFHFSIMDIRQDSRKHDGLWEEILSKDDNTSTIAQYEKLPEADKIKHLMSFEKLPGEEDDYDDFHLEMLKSFDALEEIKKRNGDRACHRYIISNCQSALHVMEVFQLARLKLSKKAYENLDVVPLFETIDDLAKASDIMQQLYEIPEYREHVKNRNEQQTIMVGFSDGTKDGGYLRANWSIFLAKEALTDISRKYGINVIFFDGRGGPPARGGGNMHDFYASLGSNIEDQEIQVTIQGQTISSNYGKVNSCRYNLEQLLSAGLENHLFPENNRQLSESERKLVDQMADISYQLYNDFKNHDKFTPYLANVTPLKYFGETNIGSRPSSRGKKGELKFEDLRAIPFVGAWAQMKQNIPGFYGVGTALKSLKDSGKEQEVNALYKDSLFFKTLLGNSMQSIAKSFYPATAYLGKDKEFGEFWHIMKKEFDLSKAELDAISDNKGMMHDAQVSKESIAIRERIVLPLISIQQYAIQKLRDGVEDEETFKRLILRSMFGIMNAARNAA